MIFALSLAFAAPTRCIASWTTPAPTCQVRGPLRIEATAGSEAAARTSVIDQLADVLELTGVALRGRSPTLSEADFGGCPAAADEAYLSCFPEPALAGFRLCFAELPAGDCWNGDVVNFETNVVRALDLGRTKMCALVDERVEAQNYTNTPLRRAECRARCEAETKVRCPE